MLDRALDYFIFGWLTSLTISQLFHRRHDRQTLDEIKDLIAEIKKDIRALK